MEMTRNTGDPKEFTGTVDGSGVKFDGAKPRLSLLPMVFLMGTISVLEHGARKYAASNWKRGMPWTRCTDAAFRHIAAWLEGEDIDPDSGLHHLDHAACNLAFLRYYVSRPEYGDLDDRDVAEQRLAPVAE